MESEGISKDPHEVPMPLKAMPKLVRLEGRNFPRNKAKQASSPETSFESKLKDDIDGPIKPFDASELPRKPYRRTHEEIEDFVAKRQRKTPVDKNPNLFSYSTNKTDIASIDKQINGYELLQQQQNGKEIYQQHTSNIRKGQQQGDPERGYDYLFGRHRRQEEDNDLSRVNFIPGSSSSSKLLSERARYKYLQPSYSSSISINGSPPKESQNDSHSVSKDGDSKPRLSHNRSAVNPIRLTDDRSPVNIGSSGRIIDRDNGGVNLSNRYNTFEHDKGLNSTEDTNVPLNLQKTFANVQGGGSIPTNTTLSTTLTMIRPNSSRKSSPASTVSSASSIALVDTPHEGKNGSLGTNLRTNDTDTKGTDRDEQSSFLKADDGKSSLTDRQQSVINYLGRVSRNNDIIITSVPRSPSSSNSSSKEELDEFQQKSNQQHRQYLQSSHKSSNDKGLPQAATFPDSISATLISQMNSSPDNIARRGELLISPAPKDAGSHTLDSPIFNEREKKGSKKQKYILALTPPIPSECMSTRKQEDEEHGEEYKNTYGASKKLNVPSSYLLDRHRRESSPPQSARVPLSLSERLDSDCSRLLSSKRDLIVERIIQPDHERASEIDLTPSSEEHSLERGTNFNQKTDYNRFNGSNNRVGENICMSSDIAQSSPGALRLKQFSKSLTGANVIQMPISKPPSALSFPQQTGKGRSFHNLDDRHERDELRDKMIGLSSLHQFEKRDHFDPAKSGSSSSSNRPENEHFLDLLGRGKSLHTSTKSCTEGNSNNSEKEKNCGDNLAKIPCDYCDHLFFREADLNDHVGRFHAGVKKYVCFACHKRFKRKQSLENHVLMIHGGSGSGATSSVGGSVVTNANANGSRNNGNNLPGRHVELTSREQMIMMMIEKGKAELAAGRRLENRDTCEN